MRHLPIRRPSPALALSSLALVAALGGAAWAAIPGPEGIIHGCYNKRTGVLRVIDTAAHGKCKRGESELNWMEVGPPGPRGGGGPRGLRGETGATGPTGPVGPSNAYTAGETSAVSLTGGQAREVLKLGLPAGDYAVTASVEIANEDDKHGGTEAAECALKRAASPTGEVTAAATVPSLEQASAQTVTLAGTWTLSAPEALELTCMRTSEGTVSAKLGRIDAIEVASITEG